MNFEDTRLIETHSLNQSDIMSDIIEQKMLKILLNTTKLRQFLLNNQLNSNKEIEEISIMGIMILLYTLAMVVTYYSILLYNNIPNSNSPKPKRRKTIKKSTKDSIESIIQSFKDNSARRDIDNSLSDSLSVRPFVSLDEPRVEAGTDDPETLMKGNKNKNKSSSRSSPHVSTSERSKKIITKKRKTIIRTP